jgi:hypothetical protein
MQPTPQQQTMLKEIDRLETERPDGWQEKRGKLCEQIAQEISYKLPKSEIRNSYLLRQLDDKDGEAGTIEGSDIAPAVEFDQGQVEHNLDGPTPEDASAAEAKRLAFVVRKLVEWLVSAKTIQPGAANSMGCRVAALAHNLGVAPYREPTLTEIAKKLGFSPGYLGQASSSLTREFGLIFRPQAQGSGPRRAAERRRAEASTASNVVALESPEEDREAA